MSQKSKLDLARHRSCLICSTKRLRVAFCIHSLDRTHVILFLENSRIKLVPFNKKMCFNMSNRRLKFYCPNRKGITFNEINDSVWTTKNTESIVEGQAIGLINSEHKLLQSELEIFHKMGQSNLWLRPGEETTFRSSRW